MILAFEDFELDARRLELRRAGSIVEADTQVLRVLALLLRNAGRLVSKDELVQEVWEGRVVADNVITVSMARLRKAIGDQRGKCEIVKTVYGRGYRFVRPVRELSEPSRPAPALRARHARDRFVGRERVLAQLESGLAEARVGRGRLCALLGEAGIGKTSAVETFCRELPHRSRALWGFCREAGDTPPLSPWLRILRELLARPERGRLTALAATLELPAALLPTQRKESSAAFTEELWLEQQQRHRVYDAIIRLLAAASESEPLVLVFEDLHRADAATLELLGQLLEELGLMRILVVATLRQSESAAGDVARGRLSRVLGHRNGERIALRRLLEPEVHAYVAAVLAQGDERLARAVYEKSEGNPFFMAELCRQLRDGEHGEHDVLSLPDAALELVRQHAAKLDVEARGVLSTAAVIGRSFELWLLHAATGQEMGVLMGSLDAALACEVLVVAPDSATAFAFGHELVRSVLYDSLSPAERRRRHVRVAEALHQRVQLGETVPASDIAYHLFLGLPDSHPETTVHYCRLAAAAAASSFSNGDVVRYVRHALEALDLVARPSVRLRMHLVYMKAMYARGDSAAEYESATRELAKLARTSADGPMLARAAVMYNLHPGYRQLSGADEELSHALELLLPDDAAMRSVALSAKAIAAPTCFSRAETERLLEEAVPLARRSGSRAARYVALIAALHLRGGPEHVGEAEAVLQELDLLAQQNPTRMPVLPVDLTIFRSVRALQQGDVAAAGHWAGSGAVLCRRLHHGELLWHTERMQVLLSLHAGATEPALEQLQRLRERANHPGLFGLAPFVAFDKAVWGGEFAGRAQLSEEEWRALAYDAADPPTLWSLKLRALAAAGLCDEARTSLRAVAVRDLSALPCDRDLLGTLGHVVHAALIVGALDYAEAAAARLEPHRDAYAAHTSMLCEGSVPHLLGAVALARGDTERAIRELEQGLVQEEQRGLALCAGYARLALGRALLCRNQAADGPRARALLAEATSDARRLGMQRLTHVVTTLHERP